MSRCYYELTGCKVDLIGKAPMAFTKFSKIVNVTICENLWDSKTFVNTLVGYAKEKEYKKKILLIATNDNYVKLVAENKDKLSKFHTGLKASDKTRKKMSDSHKNHPSIKRKVYQYDLQNNLIKTWNSVRQIERELHLNANKIYACCNNKIENYANYI
mgnify:CR=1 FL=1